MPSLSSATGEKRPDVRSSDSPGRLVLGGTADGGCSGGRCGDAAGLDTLAGATYDAGLTLWATSAGELAPTEGYVPTWDGVWWSRTGDTVRVSLLTRFVRLRERAARTPLLSHGDIDILDIDRIRPAGDGETPEVVRYNARWEDGVHPVPEGLRLAVEELESRTGETVTAGIGACDPSLVTSTASTPTTALITRK